jgi:hypothetical protein
MAPDNGSQNPLVTLGNALSMVFGAIAIAQKGLLKNPSPEEERKLNRTLAKLELERATISAKLDALIAGNQDIAGPTPGQVQEISSLTAQVEVLTNANLTASGAVALTSRILTLATDIAAA